MTVLLPKVSSSALVAMLLKVNLTSMAVHQHPTGSDHLRIHRRMGTLSMGHIGQVHRPFLSTLGFLSHSYSAQGFLNFMNGYTIFLGPIAGIMITDVRPADSCWLYPLPHIIVQFWLVHRGRVDVPAMYDPSGRYRYTHGFVSRLCPSPF